MQPDYTLRIAGRGRLASSSVKYKTGSSGTVNWASFDFERNRGKFTANMERNVPRHHTELACLNAQSYRNLHLC
ncbi:hypothetical protein TNCV_563101 [Trichonephila clavipes]|nr:hypothetical protein TNCV_563101 [Trichonephila clavipes]